MNAYGNPILHNIIKHGKMLSMMVINSAFTWAGWWASEIEMIRSSRVLILLLYASSKIKLISLWVLSTNEGSDVESGLCGGSKSIDLNKDEWEEDVVEAVCDEIEV